MESRYKLRYVVRLCFPVRGPLCAVPGRALAGTMVVLALHVSAEPLVVLGRRAIASDCKRARRVLTESQVVCARRKLNSRCDLSMCFAVLYGCAALCVGLSC